LKVQDGCDYSCTYCTIPLARGKSRSDSIINIIRQAGEIAQQGIKEIVLSGVNIGDFGFSGTTGKRNENLLELITELDRIEGIQRFRISSIEPNLLNDQIIEFIAGSKKFVPHFHIPLQSGSDFILKRMKRRYLSALYQNRIETIKTLLPQAGIGADVIVGFPGETEEYFRETFDFIHGLPLSYLHVFTYSERDNTEAISMTASVPSDVRLERNRLLRQLSDKKRNVFYNEHLYTSRPVLWECENDGGYMLGYTDNYIRVRKTYSESHANTIQNELLIHTNGSEVYVRET
jgi:threonylcarbamoyladenosine tRNA methylthiotransferase MtaB